MNENPSSEHQKRLFIVVALSMAVLFGWQLLATEMGWVKPPSRPDAGVAVAGDAGALEPDAGAVAAAPTPPSPEAAEPEAAPAVEPTTIEVSTPTQELVFSSRGGGLSQAILRSGGHWKPYKFERREKKDEPGVQHVDMVRTLPSQPLPGASELTGGLNVPYSTEYTSEKLPDGVRFVAQTGGARVEKRYWVSSDGYELRVIYNITNLGQQPAQATLAVAYPAWVDPKSEGGGSFFSPPPEQSHVICRRDRDTEKEAYDDDGVKESFAGPVNYVAFDERYFTGAIFPRFTAGTSCELEIDPVGTRTATLKVDLGTLNAGETVTRDFGMYIGPKAFNELRRVSGKNAEGQPMVPMSADAKAPEGMPPAEAIDPELETTIDFGWWAVLCTALLYVMKAFQTLVVNWGLAIILLTVMVKLLLYPLTKKSMESMEAMKKLQPQMEALKKKYENDREKLNMEMMRLYQEHKVNPFGGCLPMLIQMPVWFALYQTLLNSFELYREPLVAFWISDLTSADPVYALPLAMGITMFITQKMQPQMGDATQAKIMLYFMPAFFTFIMLGLPAGLTLYIFTNNLLSIAQQKYLQHKMKQAAAA